MRAGLAQQMRAAYMIGREEPLKLLLNQQDPRAGRMFVYYSYFGRARAGVITAIDTDIRTLADLDAQLAADEQRLRCPAECRGRSSEPAADRARPAGCRAGGHQGRIPQRRPGAAATAGSAGRAHGPAARPEACFAALSQRCQWRFQSTWPPGLAGRRPSAARFGQVRASSLKWDGMLIDTDRGADVRAVYRGRVIYADWLPGLGLLTIIDHGDGYLSLYGHNDRLYKAVGDAVAAGDVLAVSGDSGGSSRPQLYFEIRKGSRPVDPGPAVPPGGPLPAKN